MRKNPNRKIYFRLLIPAILTGVLVLDGLLGYVAPDPFNGLDPVTQVVSAESPDLELQEADAEKTVSKGDAGSLSKVDESGTYKDGTYTGTARGFGGKITVKVTVKDGKIKSITIVSAPGETGSYLKRASAVINRILKKQTTNVDAVSGATYSSNGIIKAVRNALNKARTDGKKSKVTEDDPVVTPQPQGSGEKPEVITGGNWTDGVYTGTGTGFGGELTVQVTITDGKIASIVLVTSNDEEEYMSRAVASIFPAVTDAQGTGVDTVTGATYSSNGLLEAINDALRQASAQQGDDPGEDPADDPSEDVTEEITMTDWVLYDEDEDFDDYQLTLTFTVVNGVVSKISSYSQDGESSNNAYIRSAVNGINSQLSAGTDASEVDAVTGATCSSTTIKNMLTGLKTEGRIRSAEAREAAEAEGEETAAAAEAGTAAPEACADASGQEQQEDGGDPDSGKEDAAVPEPAETEESKSGSSAEPAEEEEKDKSVDADGDRGEGKAKEPAAVPESADTGENSAVTNEEGA